MPLQNELSAYTAKINLPLLDSITAFVLDTAEATRAQRAELHRQCPFLTRASGEALSLNSPRTNSRSSVESKSASVSFSSRSVAPSLLSSRRYRAPDTVP